MLVAPVAWYQNGDTSRSQVPYSSTLGRGDVEGPVRRPPVDRDVRRRRRRRVVAAGDGDDDAGDGERDDRGDHRADPVAAGADDLGARPRRCVGRARRVRGRPRAHGCGVVGEVGVDVGVVDVIRRVAVDDVGRVGVVGQLAQAGGVAAGERCRRSCTPGRRRSGRRWGPRSTRQPASTAERRPVVESSIATQSAASTPSRSAATRYGSGSGLPLATSSPATITSNESAAAPRPPPRRSVATTSSPAPSGRRSRADRRAAREPPDATARAHAPAASRRRAAG